MLNHTEVKLVKVGSLNTAFRKNANQKVALTISALYHAVVHGNVAFADDWQRTDATMLDAVLRPLFPMSYSNKDKKYSFNGVKAKEVQEHLNVEFQKEGFASFAEKVLAFYSANEKQTKKKELAAVDVAGDLEKAAKALVKKFMANGVSLDALKTAIVLAEKGELK